MLFLLIDADGRLSGFRSGAYAIEDLLQGEVLAPDNFTSQDFLANQFCLYRDGVFTRDQTAIDLQYERDNPTPPVKTPEEIQSEITIATQKRLDDFARERFYDGILSLCTYATSQYPKFRSEGQYGVTARDGTWGKLYEILVAVQDGTRPMPSGYAEIESELPALIWP